MFKNILDFWQGKDFLTQVLTDFGEMLSEAQTMFIMASKLLVEKAPPETKSMTLTRKLMRGKEMFGKELLSIFRLTLIWTCQHH